MRTPRLCKSGCGRPVRRIRGAAYCSPCITKIPKKPCAACGEAFHVDRMTGPRCKPCASQKAHSERVAKTYGMTGEQYIELLAYQEGRCYICHRRPQSKRLAVDHDHATGLVRGLLCRSCNRDVLGHLRDSVEALRRAIDYLTSTPASELWGDDTPVAPEG